MELCVQNGCVDPRGRGSVSLLVYMEGGGLAEIGDGALPEAHADPAAAVVRAAEVRRDVGGRGAVAG